MPAGMPEFQNRTLICSVLFIDIVGYSKKGVGEQVSAGDEIGVRTPLRDLAMTKADVRAVSHGWNLSTWDKPAMPCLASRVRYGIAITPARLARVERAELAVLEWLTAAGTPTRDLRVRDLGDTGRVELDPHLADRPEIGTALAEVVRAAGFDGVELAVFRSGALNHEPVTPRRDPPPADGAGPHSRR